MDKASLEKLKNVDIKTVDRNLLADISAIKIDDGSSQAERMKSLLSQIKNPYCFKVGKWVVGVDFINTANTLEDKIKYIVA